MIDLSDTVIAKSDQLNAVDLIGGPITIKITGVKKTSDAQPVVINYEGDNGRPFKPCKTMRRLLIGMWKNDGSKYVGRSLTLYMDPDVKWAGKKEGGVRISHASDIPKEQTFVLRETKNSTLHYAVKPLKVEQTAAPEQNGIVTPTAEPDAFDLLSFMGEVDNHLSTACDADELQAWWDERKPDRMKAGATDKAAAIKIAETVKAKIAALRGEGEV